MHKNIFRNSIINKISSPITPLHNLNFTKWNITIPKISKLQYLRAGKDDTLAYGQISCCIKNQMYTPDKWGIMLNNSLLITQVMVSIFRSFTLSVW